MSAERRAGQNPSKTPAQIARHWITYSPPKSVWTHIFRGAAFRDVGPYRVVIRDGKVIGHTMESTL